MPRYEFPSGGHLYNVKGFGVVGDGATNDTAALQAIINLAASQGGGEVFLPAGTHRVSNVTLPSNVYLCGATSGVTILRRVTGTVLPILTNADTGGGNTKFKVQDIIFDGENLGDSVTGLCRFINCTDFTLERVTVKNRYQLEATYVAGGVDTEGALDLKGCSYATLLNCSVIDCRNLNPVDHVCEGLLLRTCNNINVIGGYYARVANSGIGADYNSNYCNLIGVTLEDNGFWASSSQCSWSMYHGLISGCTFKGGYGVGLHLGHPSPSNSASYMKVIGNAFVDHKRASIILAHGSHGVIIAANIITHPTVTKEAYPAISMSTPPTADDVCVGVSILDNHIYDCYYGLYITGTDTQVRGNRIEGCNGYAITVNGNLGDASAGDANNVMIADLVATDIVKLEALAGAGINVVGLSGTCDGLVLRDVSLSAVDNFMTHGYYVTNDVIAAAGRFENYQSFGHTTGLESLGTGLSIRRRYTNAVTWNPPSLLSLAAQTTTVTVTGARVSGSPIVSISLGADLLGTGLSGYVSADDTVTVVHTNNSAAPVDVGSGSLRAVVEFVT